jgi:hypothetical protein
MSRLTGNLALGLFEAYQAVYNPQQYTKDQLWEEVEYWVNELMREGYDLSDYTWEEMYESYDYYNTIVCYLLGEGYVDSVESSLVVMANMSEEWRQSIVEGGTGAFVPSRVDDFNNRRDMLKNRYGQDVSPRIPGPSGGGQGGTKPTAGVLKLARGTSSPKRGVESKNNA